MLVISFAIACFCDAPVSRPGVGPVIGRSAVGLKLPGAAATPAPLTRTGCAEFLVRITGDKSAVVATPVGEQCGWIAPALVRPPRFDSARHEVRLDVALRNAGPLQLHGPAALTARRASIQVRAAPAAGQAFRLVSADSLTGDSTSATGVRWWSFDQLLRASGDRPLVATDGEFVVPSGGTSAPRTLVLTVPPGVSTFQLTLNGIGTTQFTVPAEPPVQVSQEEREDSRSAGNQVTGDPRFPGRVVRNKLWLLFRRDATIEQRQAAVDAVQGVVIGGDSFGPSRYYYIRIPANPDSGATSLERAIRMLAPLAQVQDVMPDHPDRRPGT